MAGAIANLSVRLSANIASFSSGIQKAIKPLKELGSQVASLGGMVNPMVTAFAGLAGAASLGALVKGQMDAIDSTAKLSDRLGISTEALTGLQHAADLSGVSSETLTGGLEKMLNTIGKAANGEKTATDALDGVGLSAESLANMKPDEAFAKIADGLVSIQNPAMRAAAAQDIFGKSGQQLLPLMLSGAEGIKAAQAEAEKLGLTFSRVDAAKVEMANDAMTKVGSVMTGIGRTLSIQLAPYIQAAADAFTGLATSGDGMGAKVTLVFKTVLSTVATLADYLKLPEAAFYLLRAASQKWASDAAKSIGIVIQGIEWLYEKLTGTKSNFGQLVVAMGEDIASDMQQSLGQAGQAWNDFTEGKNSKAVEQFFTNLENNASKAAQALANGAPKPGSFVPPQDVEALKKVTESVEKLQTEVNQFNMTDAEKKLADFSAMKGVTPEQINQYAALLSQMDQLKAAKEQQKKIDEDAKKIWEETRTPMEKYEAEIDRLHDMLENGSISWDTYGRAVRKAKADLEKDSEDKTKEAKAPDLMLAGSAAAQRFSYDLTRGSSLMNKDEIAKKQLASQQKAENYLEAIAKNTGGGFSDDTTVMDIPV